ncbi:MAG TPA: hypothetical protein VGB94_12345 [Acidobacteriaceae bacterium]
MRFVVVIVIYAPFVTLLVFSNSASRFAVKRYCFDLLLLLFLFGTPVWAQPIYLSCVIPPEKKSPEFHADFTLDETTGTVLFEFSGQILKEPALFTSDKVVWKFPFVGGTIRRTINRVTLEYTDETIGSYKTYTSKGTCQVMAASTDRKF